MYDEEGVQVWERSLDMNGKVVTGDNNACPFTFQGQEFDKDIELCYNRFRWYSSEDGRYISQDPIGLRGGHNLYGFVEDSNFYVDVFGLSSHASSSITFTDSAGTTLTANGYTDLSHLTNTELDQLHYMNTSGSGLSPRDKANRDVDPSGKSSNVIVGHHYKQQAGGPIVMMPAKHHDKKHTNATTSDGRSGQHPNGKRAGGGLTETERKAFNNWKKEFYAHLAQEEINNRRKSGTYKK